jgi:hypothetical protein
VTPNLFLVGTQRSATTALWSYLGRHPDIFMAPKELHRFGADLSHFGDVDFEAERPTMEQYLSHFASASGERWLGDASVGYIYSGSAAQEIKGFSPEARIIASFRNPVDVAYSLHSLMRFQGAEPEPSFELAVADETNARWAFTSTSFRWAFTYPRLLRFAEQLSRYLDVFPREHIHVVLYEDFAADPAGTFEGILDFLGLERGASDAFPVVNGNRKTRSPTIERWITRPTPVMRRATRVLVPRRSDRRQLAQWVIANNQRPEERPPLADELRRRLERELGDEVDDLSSLLDRDLVAEWGFGSP